MLKVGDLIRNKFSIRILVIDKRYNNGNLEYHLLFNDGSHGWHRHDLDYEYIYQLEIDL